MEVNCGNLFFIVHEFLMRNLFTKKLTIEDLRCEFLLRPHRINERSGPCRSPVLLHSCLVENWEVAKELIRMGANVNARNDVCPVACVWHFGCDDYFWAPVSCCAFLLFKFIFGFYQLWVRLFCLKFENSSLCKASGLGNVEVVELLIAAGAVVEFQDKVNKTIIVWLHSHQYSLCMSSQHPPCIYMMHVYW